MAILSNTSPLYGATGVVGGLLLRTIHGKTVASVYVRPRKQRKTSALQQLTRSRFAEASRKAKALLLDMEMYEYYKRKAKTLGLGSAYTAAVTDVMRGSESAAAEAISPSRKAVPPSLTLLRAKGGRGAGIRKADDVRKPLALVVSAVDSGQAAKREGVVRPCGALGSRRWEGRNQNRKRQLMMRIGRCGYWGTERLGQGADLRRVFMNWESVSNRVDSTEWGGVWRQVHRKRGLFWKDRLKKEPIIGNTS